MDSYLPSSRSSLHRPTAGRRRTRDQRTANQRPFACDDRPANSEHVATRPDACPSSCYGVPPIAERCRFDSVHKSVAFRTTSRPNRPSCRLLRTMDCRVSWTDGPSPGMGHGRSNILRGDSEHAPDLSERVPTPLERSPGCADALRPLCERPSVTLRTCDGRSAAIGAGAPNADWSRCDQEPSLLRTPIGEGRTRDGDCRTQIGQSRTSRLSVEAL
jgi:hypothetical protein